MNIVRFSAADVDQRLDAFAGLLVDVVADGASIGFLAPLDPAEASAYWRSVVQALRGEGRVLLAAFDSEGLAGTVQLDLAGMPNGSHRAEVVKLMVHLRARGQGLGADLMRQVESLARQHGRSLLVLDTRRGDPSESLYRRIGYQEAGAIPRYARSSTGQLHETVFFYKEL